MLAETTAALHVLDHGLVEHAEVLQEPRLADKGPLAQLTGPVLEEFLAAELVAHVLAKVGEGAVAQHKVHPGELSATKPQEMETFSDLSSAPSEIETVGQTTARTGIY